MCSASLIVRLSRNHAKSPLWTRGNFGLDEAIQVRRGGKVSEEAVWGDSSPQGFIVTKLSGTQIGCLWVWSSRQVMTVKVLLVSDVTGCRVPRPPRSRQR